MAQSTSLASRGFKWSNPNPSYGSIVERQSGYNPKLSSCGIGTTCVSACGSGFVTCNANTNLALFCYNPSRGQTCCNNGDGRACDAGYYCARDLSNTTWCCENQYNLAQCASMYQISTLITGPPTTSTVSSTTTAPGTVLQLQTSSSTITSTTTSAAITQHNTSASTETIAYLNSSTTNTPIPMPFTGNAPPHTVSWETAAVLGILLFSLLSF